MKVWRDLHGGDRSQHLNVLEREVDFIVSSPSIDIPKYQLRSAQNLL